MTDVVTQTCTRCGAGIYGTNFCENCGTRAMGSVAPVTATGGVTPIAPSVAASGLAPQYAPTSSRGGTALRVITLLVLLSTLVVPAIMSMLPPTGNEYELQNGVGATLECLVGSFALLAAVTGRASGGAKFGGALLALGYITLAMLDDFTGLFYNTTVTLELAGSMSMLLLFLSWAVSRPFRGPGYFGVLVLIALEFADAYIVPAVYGSAGTSATILIALIGCVLVLATVGLAVLFERGRSAQETIGSAVIAGPVPVTIDGPSSGKARASLTMALIALGLNVLSRLVPYGLGITISILALGLLIAAIIVGHLARRDIRTTGQRGAGLALAGMLIGYIVLAIDVAVILAVFLFTAALVANL
jgi:hypothetical protein